MVAMRYGNTGNLSDGGNSPGGVSQFVPSEFFQQVDITATVSSTSNIPTAAVNLNSADVLIVGIIETGTVSAAHIYLPYVATSGLYGIHVLKSDMTSASGASVTIRIYYINRSSID